MSPLSGINTDSISTSTRVRRYSSDAVVGLGSLLHDQNIFYRTTQASVLLGLTTQIISTPAFDATVSTELNDLIKGGNGTDDIKEEDIWTRGQRSRFSVSSRDKQKLIRIGEDHHHMYETDSNENEYDSWNGDRHTTTEHKWEAFRQRRTAKGCTDQLLSDASGNSIPPPPISEVNVIPPSQAKDVRRSMPIALPSPSRSISFQNMHYAKRTSLDDIAHRQSAPVNVPDWSKIRNKKKEGKNGMRKKAASAHKDEEEEENGEEFEEKIPPHELLAREQADNGKVTFSVCEGQGRTLKGRDICRMRNAVWKQIGFAD